jgi:hypothetical protein
MTRALVVRQAWAAIIALLTVLLVAALWPRKEAFLVAPPVVKFFTDAKRQSAVAAPQPGFTGDRWVEIPPLQYLAFTNQGDTAPQYVVNAAQASGSALVQQVMFKGLTSVWSSAMSQYAYLGDGSSSAKSRLYHNDTVTPWAPGAVSAITLAPKSVLFLNAPKESVEGAIAYVNDQDRVLIFKLGSQLTVSTVRIKPYSIWERASDGRRLEFTPFVVATAKGGLPRYYSGFGPRPVPDNLESLQVGPIAVADVFAGDGSKLYSVANPRTADSDPMEVAAFPAPVPAASLVLKALQQ